jgi:hypothetical protein
MNQVLKIRTEKDIYPSESVLLMEIGETDCSFGIMHHASRIIYEFAYYKADPNYDDDLLKKIFDKYELLLSSFYRTVISWYMPECILIPNKFYDHQQSKILLDTIFGEDSNVAISESLPEWQVNAAYHLPATAHETINRHYTTGNFWHHYSIMLKNKIDNAEGGSFTVDFKTDSFSVVAARNNSLLLAQVFPYTSAEDVLYWLLKICRQYSLSQNEVKVALSGLVDKQSSVFKELYQYFLNIQFASLENRVQLSEVFSEFPDHYFTSLSRLAACVS